MSNQSLHWILYDDDERCKKKMVQQEGATPINQDWFSQVKMKGGKFQGVGLESKGSVEGVREWFMVVGCGKNESKKGVYQSKSFIYLFLEVGY